MSKPPSPMLREALASPLAPVLALYALLSATLWAGGIELLGFIPGWKPFVLGQPLPTAVVPMSTDPVSAGSYFSNLYALFFPAVAAALVAKPPAQLAPYIPDRKSKSRLVGFALAVTFVFVTTASAESMLHSRSFPIARMAILSLPAMAIAVTAYAAALVWLAYAAISLLYIGFVQREDSATN